jgi:membrane-bound lytic murein transglycosylase
MLTLGAVSACDAASAERRSAPTVDPLRTSVAPPRAKQHSEKAVASTGSAATQEAVHNAPSAASATNAKTPAVPPAAASARERFAAYWSQFRSAIERNDKQAQTSMTKFPFETRGMYDDQPVRKHNAARFAEVIDKLLDEGAGEREPMSMRQLILKTSEVSGNGFSGVQARVGTFSFRDLKEGWRLVRVYTDMFEPDDAPSTPRPKEAP